MNHSRRRPQGKDARGWKEAELGDERVRQGRGSQFGVCYEADEHRGQLGLSTAGDFQETSWNRSLRDTHLFGGRGARAMGHLGHL